MQSMPPPAQVAPRRSPRLPLTAVSTVCELQAGLDALAPLISSFIDPATSKRWTIQLACERGHVQLLRRLIVNEPLPQHQHPMYRSHVFGDALVHAVRHGNAIDLLECLHAYCPTGYATKGFAEAARLGKVHLMDWLLEHHQRIESSPAYAKYAVYAGHLHVLQWLQKSSLAIDLDLIAVLDRAVRCSQFAAVKWILETVAREDIVNHYGTDWMDGELLFSGDLDMLKYLHEEQGHRFRSPSDCLGCAAMGGNLETLKWFYAKGYTTCFYYDLPASAVSLTSSSG